MPNMQAPGGLYLSQRGKKFVVTGNIQQWGPHLRQYGGEYKEYADSMKAFAFPASRITQITPLVQQINSGQIPIAYGDLPKVPPPKTDTPKSPKKTCCPAGFQRAIFDVELPSQYDSVILDLGPDRKFDCRITGFVYHPTGFVRRVNLEEKVAAPGMAPKSFYIVIVDGEWKVTQTMLTHKVYIVRATPVVPPGGMVTGQFIPPGTVIQPGQPGPVAGQFIPADNQFQQQQQLQQQFQLQQQQQQQQLQQLQLQNQAQNQAQNLAQTQQVVLHEVQQNQQQQQEINQLQQQEQQQQLQLQQQQQQINQLQQGMQNITMLPSATGSTNIFLPKDYHTSGDMNQYGMMQPAAPPVTYLPSLQPNIQPNTQVNTRPNSPPVHMQPINTAPTGMPVNQQTLMPLYPPTQPNNAPTGLFTGGPGIGMAGPNPTAGGLAGGPTIGNMNSFFA